MSLVIGDCTGEVAGKCKSRYEGCSSQRRAVTRDIFKLGQSSCGKVPDDMTVMSNLQMKSLVHHMWQCREWNPLWSNVQHVCETPCMLVFHVTNFLYRRRSYETLCISCFHVFSVPGVKTGAF